MAILFKNNASTKLASGITAAATSMTVLAETGNLFPAPGANEYFLCTLVDDLGNKEIVKVTSRNADVFTIVRAQEGTTARAFNANSLVENRLTAGALNEVLNVTYASAAEVAAGVETTKAISPATVSSANVASATTLRTPRTLTIGNTGKGFDGSADVAWSLDEIGGDASLTNYLPSGTGAVARTVQDKLREVVSVKDFGAVGDGVTDDTAAIQAALDSGAKRIYFNDGHTFLVTSTIESNTNGVELYGGGWVRCNLEEAKVLVVRGSSTKVHLNIDGLNLARIGIEIPQGFGDNFVISNCHIKNLRSEIQQAFAFVTWSDAPGVVKNNLFENVFSLGDNGGPSIPNGRSGGVQVSSNTAIRGSIEITNNTIKEIYGEEGDSISVQVGVSAPFLSSNIYIADNVLQNFSRRAIKIQVSGAVVHGNFCVSNDAITHARPSNVISVISCDGCSVVDNEIRANNKFVGISVNGEGIVGRNAERNMVSGNRIYNPKDVAIILDRAEFTHISSNVAYGAESTCVGVTNSPRTVVIANTSYQTVTSTTRIIFTLQNSPYSVISANTISGSSIYRAILLQSQYSVVSENNVLSENISSATFSGPGSGALNDVLGCVIAENHVRNTSSVSFINFGGASTLRISQNHMLGDGSSDTSTNSLVFAASNIPSTVYPNQAFRRGNVALNLNATSGQPAGWVCVASGTPGTWLPLANL